MIGYLDLPSGISGDMFLGCLLDAGWPIEQLRATLANLHLPDAAVVEARSVMKGPFRATRADVRLPEPTGTTTHEHHAHGPHTHTHEHASHAHRNLNDIRRIIRESNLAGVVKEKSIAVFTRLANAEAKVHGTTVDQIHFHEVGALDAIVDIVCTVAGVHELGLDQLFASALPLGHGWIDSQHGALPLPAPATLELLSAARAPTRQAPGPGELVTPTGAALVCELAKFEQPLMQLQRIAIGAGMRDTAWPNVARLWIGAAPARSSASGDSIVQVETNIDDMNPQLYGPLIDKLLATGALDVWITPIQMKKNRPGVVLAVLAASSRKSEIADILLRETTTLGLRIVPVDRMEADRETQLLDTPFGAVQIKLKKWGGKVVGAMPEYEDCRKLAESKKLPLKMVYDAALSAAHAAFLGS